jgi:uncharacterized membrane protein
MRSAERVVDRSPSRVSWTAAVVLAALGFIDAAYLTWVKLAHQTSSCAGIGDCETVNTSRFSEVGGVPIALAGAAAYLVILLLLYLDRPGTPGSETARLALFGVTFAGTLYSAYLTYIELFVLKAVCPFCVFSAVMMVGLFILSLVRLRLWGTPSEEA